MTQRPQRTPPVLLLAVLAGGAVGGALRWLAGDVVPDGGGFPQTVLAINVVGSFLLALLPALPAVRRHRTLAVALGPGLLGGFTTLSTASEQTRALLATQPATGALYAVGTLAACLLAVALASRLSSLADQDAVQDEGGDE